MEDLIVVLTLLQKGFVCVGLDFQDAFLHVLMRPRIKKFLRFPWKEKLYEWQVLEFALKFARESYSLFPLGKGT